MPVVNGRWPLVVQLGIWLLSLIVAILLTYAAMVTRITVVETQQIEVYRRLANIDSAIQQIQASAVSSQKVLEAMLEIQKATDARAAAADRDYRQQLQRYERNNR